jgi:hypothetical protein
MVQSKWETFNEQTQMKPFADKSNRSFLLAPAGKRKNIHHLLLP